MDKTIELAKQLHDELLPLPEIKEYLRLKKLYHEDEELKRMRQEIARLKNENKEEERENLLKIYHQHPLVNNYFLAKEEAENILREIKQELENF